MKFKNQHYVPEFYLKRFAKNDDQIFVYDKFSRSSFGPTSVSNIASERYFYDVDLKEGEDTEDLDPQFIEKLLGKFENDFSEIMDVAIGVAEGKGATFEQRADMAFFIAVQWMRTRAFRERVTTSMEMLAEASLNSALELAVEISTDDLAKQLRGLEARVEKYSKRGASALHFDAMWDSDLLEKTTRKILESIWLIGINESDTPFWTSDSPVVLQSHIDRSSAPPNPNVGPAFYKAIDITLESSIPGIGERGVEIIFPLTPKYVLIILESSYFEEVWKNDGKLLRLKQEWVNDFNRLQVIQSYRQVYSHTDNFDAMKEIHAKYPEAFDPEHKDITIRRWHWNMNSET